jgi:hypothetical protein
MQEINLLKNQLKDNTIIWQRRNKILTTAFVLVLIMEFALAVLFFLVTQTTQAKKAFVTEDNRQTQNRINESQDDLLPAKAFQAQLQNLGTLLDNHVYWTNFLDELSEHTFTQGRFTTLQASPEGTIYLEGEVDSYGSLGKMLLGLSTSGKFTEVKLIASSPSKAETFSIIFAVNLKINPELLQGE